MAKRGPLSFTIKLNDGRMWNRHIDHVASGNHGNAQNLHNQPEPYFDWGLPLCTPELATTATTTTDSTGCHKNL